jgi:cytochrome P450
VRRPVEVQGVSLEVGRAVLGLLGAANRDPDRYPNPDDFQADRKVGDHLAFGFGIHYCVGAPLARIEADAMVRALLDRFQELEIEHPTELTFEGPVYRSPLSLTISGQAS